MKITGAGDQTQARFGGFPFEVLDAFLEGCQVIGRDWRYLYVNEAVAEQAHMPRDRLLGRTMMEVFPGIENTEMFAVLRRCMTERAARRMDNKFVFPDGSVGWFDLRFEPVPDGVFILSLEFTHRKQAEEEHRLLAEVLQLTNAARTRADLLEPLLDRLQSLSGCEAVAVRLKEGPDHRYAATRGYDPQFLQLESTSGGGDEPNRLPTDDELLARTRDRCRDAGYESVALLPLRSGLETFGLLQFSDKRPGRITAEGGALLRRVADQVAHFLAKRQADTRIAHLNAVLRGIRDVNQLITREKDPDALIQQACDLLVRARGFHAVVIALAAGPQERISGYAAVGAYDAGLQGMIEKGALPDCIRLAMAEGGVVTRKSRRLTCAGCPAAAEAPDDQAALIIALRHEEHLYGAMIACLPAGLGDDPDEHDLLQEVAGDIAFALHGIEVEKEHRASADALARTQEQLRQAQRLEAVGQLAGGIAHDFNNILMAQFGYCDLLSAELPEDSQAGRDLGQVRACAERAAALTRQLLAFSRKQPLRPEILDLNAVVGNIDKMLRRLIGEDIDFRLDLSPQAGRILADVGQLEQVVMNLVLNARDAMPAGGRLTVQTASASRAPSAGDDSPRPHAVLAVSDTGVGMDADTLAKVFEPFFTTKGPGRGTGLGLATVYGIVKQSGGDIEACSEPGAGSTFTIFLPAVQGGPAPAPRPMQGRGRGRGQRIMVVEDAPDLRGLLERMLSRLGYQARVAGDGEEALALIEQEGFRPDLFITDMVMPGMGGRELVNRLRARGPQVPVLFMSGYSDPTLAPPGAPDPQAPFLQKPFTIEELGAAVEKILAGA